MKKSRILFSAFLLASSLTFSADGQLYDHYRTANPFSKKPTSFTKKVLVASAAVGSILFAVWYWRYGKKNNSKETINSLNQNPVDLSNTGQTGRVQPDNIVQQTLIPEEKGSKSPSSDMNDATGSNGLRIEANTIVKCDKNVSSVDIPNSVTSIGFEAFCGCTSLTQITIPSSVTSIGKWAFSDCISLTQIEIPSSVTSIGARAFEECTSLTTITFQGDSSMTSIGIGVFSGCTSLTQINIPSSVTSIGEGAFSGCESLTQITIPSSVTSIGEWAFSDCISLTQITIPTSVTSIGEGAFSGCESLQEITIPESVTSIEEGAFYKCKSLTQIIIPSSVTSIGNRAFYECGSLIQSTTPSSETSIIRKANTTRKLTVTIPKRFQEKISSFFSSELMENIEFNYIEEKK